MGDVAAVGEMRTTAPARTPALAWWPVGSAMLAMGVVLTATSGGYGYHRDELYFRMLPPAWGYVDQPPLTPLLVRVMSSLVDEVWAVRVPATLAAVATVLLVALTTREVGGGRFAQGLSAWGYAFAAFPLAFGHMTFTAGLDVLAWVATTLFVMRAVLRHDPRWWLAAGAAVGVATLNKLLIPLLVVSLLTGLAAVGPRRLPWRWVLGGVAVAALLALPTGLYEAFHGWPQLTMARALSAKNAAENRVLMWPMLLLLLGPGLVPMWVTGLVALWRRPEWRDIRFLAVAFAAILALCALSGGQVHYPLGLLAVIYAVGCVPVAKWLQSNVVRRRLVLAAVTVNSLVAVLISLPVVPESVVGGTPIPGINQAMRDSVGWPTYVQQVASVYASLSPTERNGAVVVTTNYGEAAAISRYGPALGLPAPVSGHNELFFQAQPPETLSVVVAVGRGASNVAARNATCQVAGRLDNGVSVHSEEQAEPVSVCRDPARPWSVVWPQFQHYD